MLATPEFQRNYKFGKYEFVFKIVEGRKTSAIRWYQNGSFYGLWQHGFNVFRLLWLFAVKPMSEMKLVEGSTPPRS